MQERVILVNENDEPIGTNEKIMAHRLGQLHRAFSIFILYQQEDEYELLLQKRHGEKYHSGNLWSNTCCSHPRPEENLLQAADRRLKEEIGIQCHLTEIGAFQYRHDFGTGFIEHEYDHVLVGVVTDKDFIINPQEISAAQWITIEKLQQDLLVHSEKYTVWFQQAFAILLKWVTT